MENPIQELCRKERFDINDLLRITRILRSESGCPWDREQTHQSVRTAVIEEAYETAEAIDRASDEMMTEELGDLLFQVVFHAQMAQERNGFDFDDICDGICKKMILRHPHVFGDINCDTSARVLEQWDVIKAQSKGQESLGEVLDGVCTALPALTKAAKLSKKAAKAGAYLPKPVDFSATDELNVGKYLFEAAAWAQKNGVDPEDSLQRYCKSFIESVK